MFTGTLNFCSLAQIRNPGVFIYWLKFKFQVASHTHTQTRTHTADTHSRHTQSTHAETRTETRTETRIGRGTHAARAHTDTHRHKQTHTRFKLTWGICGVFSCSVRRRLAFFENLKTDLLHLQKLGGFAHFFGKSALVSASGVGGIGLLHPFPPSFCKWSSGESKKREVEEVQTSNLLFLENPLLHLQILGRKGWSGGVELGSLLLHPHFRCLS